MPIWKCRRLESVENALKARFYYTIYLVNCSHEWSLKAMYGYLNRMNGQKEADIGSISSWWATIAMINICRNLLFPFCTRINITGIH